MSLFDKRAQEWDKGSTRVNGTRTIAEAIKQRFQLHKEMHIMDFGVGTGLLGFEIAKETAKVYGVDTSSKMLAALQEKNSPTLSIEPILQDIIKKPLRDSFHGVVSSMTLHHIEDTKAFFSTIYKNIHKDGFIAIADLESEDGTFHSDNAGVFHFGFDAEELCKIVSECGFKDVRCEKINTIEKKDRSFDVFLLSAIK